MKKKQQETRKAVAIIVLSVLVLATLLGAYIYMVRSHPELDAQTQCPLDPTRLASITVLLVDVTDPMNVAQRQDFLNQLEYLSERIPRNGKLVVSKVDPISDQLLQPVITRCNPGTAADTNELKGNPQKLARLHEEQFRQPLNDAFQQLLTANQAERSPILESIQSVNLTEFQRAGMAPVPKTLIVVSDLLQHTSAISFYGRTPTAETLLESSEFRRTRTDLRGVDVELWMLERADAKRTQPRALAELWHRLITEQQGTVQRIYNVSG